MERFDLQPYIDEIAELFVKLSDLSLKIRQLNGYKANDATIEIDEMYGELVPINRDLVTLQNSLIESERSLNDPSTPPDLLPGIKKRFDSDNETAARLSKKAQKAINKASDILVKWSDYKPETPVKETTPHPAPKKEQAIPDRKPRMEPIRIKPVEANYIKGVYDGKVTRHNLPVGYYNSMRDPLLKAVKTGMGRDYERFADLAENLELNAQAFAGAKTYNLVAELEFLKELHGNNYSAYEAAARDLDNKFHTWGDAEVNTAQQQTSQARQWQIITDDIDLFPLLQYSTIGDACRICKPLDGMVARADSPIWVKVYPCNHYHCYCIVKQLRIGDARETDKKTLAGLVNGSTKYMAPVFQSNPGITQKIYTAKHPYFTSIPKDDKDFAKSNFGLPIK